MFRGKPKVCLSAYIREESRYLSSQRAYRLRPVYVNSVAYRRWDHCMVMIDSLILGTGTVAEGRALTLTSEYVHATCVSRLSVSVDLETSCQSVSGEGGGLEDSHPVTQRAPPAWLRNVRRPHTFFQTEKLGEHPKHLGTGLQEEGFKMGLHEGWDTQSLAAITV